MSCQVMELAAVAQKEVSCSASRVNQDKQVEYLEDELFGHLPSELGSAKVAISSCLLVDWPLQLQFPKGGNRRKITSEVSLDCQHIRRLYQCCFFQNVFM